jgi:hypothetical protein
MPLSDAQLSDLRSDLGLPAAPGVFTDDELQRNYTRAGESYLGARIITRYQLLSDAAKRNDYTIGQTSERASQVFAMLWKLQEKDEADYEVENGGNLAQIVALRPVPTTRNADRPDEVYNPAWRRRGYRW